jgi:hypothetical protein
MIEALSLTATAEMEDRICVPMFVDTKAIGLSAEVASGPLKRRCAARQRVSQMGARLM